MNKNNIKGFTLAELLIVVAIISVLTGVSIPVFTTQLEKSREATDIANVRSEYANMMVAVMSDDTSSDYWDGSKNIYKADVKLSQKKEDWQGSHDLTIAGISSGDSWRWKGHPMVDGTCEITYEPEIDRLVFNWAGSNILTNIKPVNSSWSGAGKTLRDSDHQDDIFSTYNNSTPTISKLKGLYELEGNSTYKVSVTYDPHFDDQTNPTMGVFAKATLLYDSNGKPVFDSGTGTEFVYDKEIKKGDNLTYMYTQNKDGTITYTATFTTGSALDKYYYGMNFGGMAVNSSTGVIDKSTAGVRKFSDSKNGFGLNSNEIANMKNQVMNNMILEKVY